MPVFLEILVLIWIMDKDIHIQLYFACSKTNENCLIVPSRVGEEKQDVKVKLDRMEKK